MLAQDYMYSLISSRVSSCQLPALAILVERTVPAAAAAVVVTFLLHGVAC